MLLFLLLLHSIHVFVFHKYHQMFVNSKTLPKAVQLGGAIVAAVEDDAEQSAEERWQVEQGYNTVEQEYSTVEQEFNAADQGYNALNKNTTHYINNDIDHATLDNLLDVIEKGRVQFFKQRKMLRLLVGILIAKTILIPLVLKVLTVLSTSSFVMNNVTLVTTGFLILKWILSATEAAHHRTQLRIIHMSFGGSDLHDFKTNRRRIMYVPIAVRNASNCEGIEDHISIPSDYTDYHDANVYEGKPS